MTLLFFVLLCRLGREVSVQVWMIGTCFLTDKFPTVSRTNGVSIFWVLVLSPLIAHADALPRPPDFAYGIPITARSPAPLQEIAVPQRVYEAVTQTNLSDIRVFNHTGDVLSYALSSPAPARSREQPVNVPFFPLPSDIVEGAESFSLQFRTSESGTVVDLRSGAQRGTASAGPLGYLIDASQIERGIEQITLQWDEMTPWSVNTFVTLQSSGDLATWQSIGKPFPILRLRHGSATIERNTLHLGNTHARYYWLKFAPSSPRIELTAVRVQPVAAQTPPVREWKQLMGTRDAKESTAQASAFIFDAGGVMPIDGFRVSLPRPNIAASVQVRSAPNANGPWMLRSQGIVYRIDTSEHEAVHDDLPGAGTLSNHRWFLLTVTEGFEGLGADVPALAVSWIPHRLIFIADGKAPYVLAYGNGNLKSTQQGSTPSLNTLLGGALGPAAKDAVLGQEQQLGGDGRRDIAPPPSNTGKKVLLWSVLLGGVAVLMCMALRLARNLRASDTPSPPPAA